MRRRGIIIAMMLAAAPIAVLLFPAVSAAPVRPHAVPAQPRPVSFQDRLLPAPVDGGFRDPGYWVWCGTVVKGDDGRFHHYGSRWPRGLPFGPHWLTNSEVVHSVSSEAPPAWGRFTQRDNVLYAHLFEWPVGKFVLPVDASFIDRVELLTPSGPARVTWSASNGASVVMTLPAAAPDPRVSVLRVTLK